MGGGCRDYSELSQGVHSSFKDADAYFRLRRNMCPDQSSSMRHILMSVQPLPRAKAMTAACVTSVLMEEDFFGQHIHNGRWSGEWSTAF